MSLNGCLLFLSRSDVDVEPRRCDKIGWDFLEQGAALRRGRSVHKPHAIRSQCALEATDAGIAITDGGQLLHRFGVVVGFLVALNQAIVQVRSCIVN